MKYIVKSRNIFDSVGSKPEPKALYIEENKIKKVLPYDYSGDPAYDTVEVKDYGDKLVMSSFLDAHTHIISGAVAASKYVCSDLGKCHSEEECAEMIKIFAREHPEFERIRGTGWFLGVWENPSLPSKKTLDEVVPDKPVYLQNADGHSMWLNSAALKEAGIVPKPEMKNGEVAVDENGELTGMLIEPAACEPAMKYYTGFDREELLDIFESFQKELAKSGISAMSEMFAEDYTPEVLFNYDLMKELDMAGKLKSQIYVYMKLFGYTDFTAYFETKKRYDSPHFHINGVKGFIDGVTETYTGLLLEPYADRPDTCGENLPLWPREKMQEEIIAANKEGIQVRLHCIADGSVRMALDMYEKSKQENPDMKVQNTIEHIENIHPDDIKRFREIDVIPSMQPYHVTLSNGDKMQSLGAKRCELEWPIRTIYENGGQIAIGTDFPVVHYDPFATIYAAYTRCDERGKPICQNAETERLPMDIILKAYTVGSAKVYMCEDYAGTLEPGKDANLIVLSDNLFEMDKNPMRILSTEVEEHIFEGELIYRKELL